MDLNLVFIVVAGFSSAWIFFQTVYHPRSYNRGWMIVSGLTAHLAGAVIGFILASLLPHHLSGAPQEQYGQS
jgi:uncharacterized membrane protein HdeD (DUF308 family)